MRTISDTRLHCFLESRWYPVQGRREKKWLDIISMQQSQIWDVRHNIILTVHLTSVAPAPTAYQRRMPVHEGHLVPLIWFSKC